MTPKKASGSQRKVPREESMGRVALVRLDEKALRRGDIY